MGDREHSPEATVNDSLLHLLYLKDKNLLDWFLCRIWFQWWKKVIISVSDLQSTIELADANAGSSGVNVDGDEGDQLPVTIRVLPSHLNVYY